MGIYGITCTITNKVYIGKSINIKNRWSAHRFMLRRGKHDNSYLQHAWNLHGEENFLFSIIEETSKEDLQDKEIYYIDLYKACNRQFGYNLRKEDKTTKQLTEETRKHVSEKLKQYHASKAKPVYLLNLNTGELILYNKRGAISKELVGNRDRNYILGYIVLPDNFTLEDYKLAYTKYNHYLYTQNPILTHIRVYNDIEEHVFTSYHKAAMFLYGVPSGIPQVRKCIETGIMAKGCFISLQ